MLKTDLHIHTKEDPRDEIDYDAKALIRVAAKKKYDVLSITLHKKVLYNPELKRFAKNKGIFLIPGKEAYVEGKEVLIYNYDKPVKKLEGLDKVRDEGGMVVAPHPFFITSSCLGRKLIDNIDCFDAIEYSHFYLKWLNRNKKAVCVARKYEKAMIATSDSHSLDVFGKDYTFVDADMKMDDIFEAIRKNKVKMMTQPLPFKLFFNIGVKYLTKSFIKN